MRIFGAHPRRQSLVDDVSPGKREVGKAKRVICGPSIEQEVRRPIVVGPDVLVGDAGAVVAGGGPGRVRGEERRGRLDNAEEIVRHRPAEAVGLSPARDIVT